MLKNDGFSYTKVNALVICTSGTSMSKIMRDELQQVFPEIHFLPAMSKREYQAYTGAYDIVFSSIPLKVDNTKRIFLVNELLDDEEKKMLKRQVNKELYLHEEKELYEEVSEVVKQHAKVMNPKKLESELKILLTHVKREEPKKRIDIRSLSKPSLTDLLTEEFIQFSDESEWLEVIKQSMTPLLRTHSITENYYKKMINVYEHPVSSIILRKKLAIPHLSPVDGVRKLGFSLLINQQDIYVNQSPVNLFVAIAPMDNESHLLALSQLVKISKNNQIVEALKKSKTKKECIFELKRFLSEE